MIKQAGIQQVDAPATMVISGGNPLFRRGLIDFLREIIPYRLLAEVDDTRKLPGAMMQHSPALVIVDISTEINHASETMRFLAERKASTASIVLASYTEGLLLINAHFAGIAACVVHEHVSEELPYVLSAVLKGETYLSPTLSILITGGQAGAFTEGGPSFSALTRSEKRILRLIASSNSSAQIAAQLNISTRTVDHHRLQICRKLSLSGRYSLLRYALDNRRLLLSLV